MNFKGKMMDSMMGGISPEKMKEMMEMIFSSMSSEDKQNMAKTMMGGTEDSDQEKEIPWDMIKKTMGNIGKASDIAAYATPELRSLFEEWLEQINTEIVAFIKKEGKSDPETLASTFKISKESIHYILSKLAQSGRINLKAEI